MSAGSNKNHVDAGAMLNQDKWPKQNTPAKSYVPVLRKYLNS